MRKEFGLNKLRNETTEEVFDQHTFPMVVLKNEH